MNKCLSTAIFACFAISQAVGQEYTISGLVTDEIADQPLTDAVVQLSETQGTVTDADGHYRLRVKPGTYELQVHYVGFTTQETPAKVTDRDLVLNFTLQVKGISEVKVMTDIATTRQTPLAFTTLQAKTLTERQGILDLPLALNTVPGVFSQEGGGGWYSTPFTIRGFHERNIAVMIDGIQINDMEKGQVFWGDWFEINSVMSYLQVQRGLGASKIAITSIGGTVNMITEGILPTKKFEYIQTIGSDGYLSENLSVNTGKLKKGWGLYLNGTHISGDGWANQTSMDACGYFVKLEKTWNRNIHTFSAIGSPQRDGINVMRQNVSRYDKDYAAKIGIADSVIDSYVEKGHRYNQNWGALNRYELIDGDTINHNEFINERLNYYYKRQYSLKDYWTVNDRLAWSNIGYLTLGSKGGRTFNLGNIGLDENLQLNYQAAYDKNISPAAIDTNYSFTEHRATAIRRTDENDHIQVGWLSTVYLSLSSHWSYIGGLDLRSYTAKHFSIVYDLLGGDYYVDNADKNQTSPVKKLNDKLFSNYTSYINWGGVFNQLEYHSDQWKLFTTLNFVETGYRRADYFQKKDLILPDTTFEQAVGTGDTLTWQGVAYTNQSPQAAFSKTNWIWIPGITVKAGANYNIDEYNNVFINAGYVNLAPRYVNVFDGNNHQKNDYKNQQAIATEAGYGLNHARYNIMLNAYSIWWKNKPVDALLMYTDPDKEIHYFNLNGLNALHMGIELEVKYKPVQQLTLQGIMSLGDWRWKSKDTVDIYDEDGIYLTTVAYDARNIHVGNAAQQQFGIIIRYDVIKNIWISGDYIYFTKYYADFNPLNLNDSNTYFATHADHDSWRAPAYGLLNLHAGWHIAVFQKMNFNITGHLLSALNSKHVVGMVNGDNFDAATAKVYWGRDRLYSFTIGLNY